MGDDHELIGAEKDDTEGEKGAGEGRNGMGWSARGRDGGDQTALSLTQGIGLIGRVKGGGVAGGYL